MDTNRRPDIAADVYYNQSFSFTNLHGEINPTSTTSSRAINLDTYRLGLFSKDSISTYNLATAMNIQAIGRTCTFHLTSLKPPELYPKFPKECDSEYMLTKKAQEAFTDHAFFLTLPISEFGIIQRHIDIIPEHELMTRKPEEVYRDIKDALYNMMANKDVSVALPSSIQSFIQRVYSYFTLHKTETNFIKENTPTQDEMEPRR